MTEIFYLDIYFFTNFAMDFVALCITALVSSEKTGIHRMIFSSLFGALFSCVFALVLPVPLFAFIFSIPVFLLLLFLAFGKKPARRFVSLAVLFLAASFLLGGAAETISYYMGRKHDLTLGVFLATVFLSMGLFQLFGRNLKRKLETAVVSLVIRFAGRSESFFGLVDSGLLLRDPERGRPVLILKAEYAYPLLTREFLEKIKDGGEGSVLIPMKTASGAGHLYAFCPDGIRVMNRNRRKKTREQQDVLIALDFSGGGFGGCPCLVPLSVL